MIQLVCIWRKDKVVFKVYVSTLPMLLACLLLGRGVQAAGSHNEIFKIKAGAGFNYSSHDLKNKSTGGISRITSPSNMYLTLGADIELRGNKFLKLNSRIQQIYYSDSSYYKIIEDKNFLVDLSVGLETPLYKNLFLTASVLYKENQFFEEGLTSFTSTRVGIIGLRADLTYNFYSFEGADFIFELFYASLSPNEKNTIELENGYLYGFKFFLRKKTWPLIYLGYNAHKQNSQFFKKSIQNFNIGVEYEF